MVGAKDGLLAYDLYWFWVNAMSCILGPHIVRGARGGDAVTESKREVVVVVVEEEAKFGIVVVGANPNAEEARSANTGKLNFAIVNLFYSIISLNKGSSIKSNGADGLRSEDDCILCLFFSFRKSSCLFLPLASFLLLSLLTYSSSLLLLLKIINRSSTQEEFNFNLLHVTGGCGQNFKRGTWIIFSQTSQYGKKIRHSIVASIPACHAGDQGSIPCDGDNFLIDIIFCKIQNLRKEKLETNNSALFFYFCGTVSFIDFEDCNSIKLLYLLF
jgi:hypothetical protein